MDTVVIPTNTCLSTQLHALTVQGHVPPAIVQVPIALPAHLGSLLKEAYAQLAVVALSAPTIQPTARQEPGLVSRLAQLARPPRQPAPPVFPATCLTGRPASPAKSPTVPPAPHRTFAARAKVDMT